MDGVLVMRNLFTRRRVAVGAVAAALLVGGGTVLAYWTSTGTGSGSGSVGTDDGAVTVVDTAATPLFPSTSSTVTFTAGNSGTGDQSISKIHLVSVQAYDTAAHAAAGGATGLIAGCGV
jgi:predicted ribosomally synthesized peptide with SipW-like signal peptide